MQKKNSTSSNKSSNSPSESISKVLERFTIELQKEEEGAQLNNVLNEVFSLLKNPSNNIHRQFGGQSNSFDKLVEICGNWLFYHSQSKFLPIMCNIIYLLLRQLQFSPYLEIHSIIETDLEITKETTIFRNPQTESIDILSTNTIVLESALISLILSISNLPNIMKFKSLLVVLVKISAILMKKKKFCQLFRRQKCVKVIMKFIKAILTQGNSKKDDIETLGSIQLLFSNFILISGYLSRFYSKIGKSREYFILKGGITMLATYIKKGIYLKDPNLFKYTLFSIVNLAVTSDNKISIWLSGIIPFLLTELKLISNETDSKSLQNAQLILLALWKSIIGSDEIQQELIKHGFYESSIRLLNNKPDEIVIPALIVAIYRRLILSKEALFEKFMIETKLIPKMLELQKQIIEIDINVLSYEKYLFHCFLAKELAAFLGNLLSNDRTRIVVLPYLNGGQKFLKLVKTYISIPKIVKTTFGSLVNLSIDEEGIAYLLQNEEFFLIVMKVLETYKSKYLLIEYVLRLVLATCQTKKSSILFVDSGMIKYCLLALDLHKNEESIVLNGIMILRSICTQKISIQKLIDSVGLMYDKASGTVGKTTNNQLTEEEEKKSLFEFIKFLMQLIRIHIDNPKLISEMFLFLSFIMQSIPIIKDSLQSTKDFSKIISECINHHSKNKVNIEIISQSLAHLPIEDIDLMEIS